jgi:hypothetical protein
MRLKPIQNQLVTIITNVILGRGFRNKFNQRHLFKYVDTQNL